MWKERGVDGGAISHVQNSFWLNQKYLKSTVILALDLVSC